MKTSDVREPGWYWVRGVDHPPQRWCMAHVWLDSYRGMTFQVVGWASPYLVAKFECAEWVGPLREPMEVRDAESE